MTEPEELLEESKNIAEESNDQAPEHESDIPEDGFVPFQLELAEKKRRRKIRMLIILSVLAALLGILLIFGRLFNFYDRTMKHLRFDYRGGETIDNESIFMSYDTATEAEKSVQDKTLNLNANVYCFDDKANLSLVVSQYRYSRSEDGTAELKVKLGAKGGILTKTNRFRTNAEGQVLEIRNGKESISADTATALLYDYFFSTEDHGNINLQCTDAYRTVVGEKTYECEVWLMSVTRGAGKSYYTIYRYYDDQKLAAVRVIDSADDLMMVYDITEYTAE